MALTVVVAYDVSEDRTRARCAALLQSVGDRVQRSVYVLIIDPDQLVEISTRIDALIDHSRDHVAYYRQCQNCWAHHEAQGTSRRDDPKPYWHVP